MSIFSIFTFKKGFASVFSKENVQEFLTFVREQIVSYVDKKDLLGAEKKEAVDANTVAWVQEHLKGKHDIVDWLIDNILIPLIPVITQKIYDFLKEFVTDLTK